MLFEEDDELEGVSSESLIMSEEELGEEYGYINDPDKAAHLISTLLSDNSHLNEKTINSIKKDIKRIFGKFGNICIKDEIAAYEEFIHIIEKLNELNKYRQICDKSVVGVGGHYSAGKSRFISSIIGYEGLLPVDTKPTTSIPTYIIKGKQDRYIANNSLGSSCELTAEQMRSISHEFFKKWKIGFAAFLENIVVSSRKWTIPDNIAILDTPGTEKPDNKTEYSLSDSSKAMEQLVTADHLIWLVDIENGELKTTDTEFIKRLNLCNPILIVINKADKKTKDQRSIMEKIKQTVLTQKINCYGIAVYSSMDNKEYMHCTFGDITCSKDETLIAKYINTASLSASSSTIMTELEKTERALLSSIYYYDNVFNADVIREMINNSSQVMNIKSLALLYRLINAENYSRSMLDHSISSDFDKLNKKVKHLLEEMDNVQ